MESVKVKIFKKKHASGTFIRIGKDIEIRVMPPILDKGYHTLSLWSNHKFSTVNNETYVDILPYEGTSKERD